MLHREAEQRGYIQLNVVTGFDATLWLRASQVSRSHNPLCCILKLHAVHQEKEENSAAVQGEQPSQAFNGDSEQATHTKGA